MLKKLLAALVIVILLAVAGFFVLGPGITERAQNGVESDAVADVSEADKAFHDGLVIADLHADSLLWNRNLLERGNRGHVDIPRMMEGNVALQVFTTVTKTPAGLNYDHNAADARDNITLLAIGQLWPMRTWTSLAERALYQASRLAGWAEAAPDRLMIIRSVADLEQLLARRADGEAVVGGLLGTEGSHALERDIANIDRLYDAGFRMMSLQHFFDNALGGSLHGAANGGLTDFGRQVVRRIEEKSIMLDVSHSSEQAVRDVLAMATRPLIVSHTGTHGNCQSPRNLPDALMREIAAAGGLIGIGYWAAAVCDYSPKGVAKALIDAVNLLGEEHVGLGSDFDGAVTTKFDVSGLSQVTAELRRQGMADETIARVMGGNQVEFFAKWMPDR